jgi:OmpA-OmpF porin, OOP family
LVLLLKQNINLEISLSGHTDDVGHDNDNLLLSQARSNAVKTYLTNNGIAISRLTSEGFGEKNPIASNSTEEGRQLNRRVEFTITKN